MQALGGGPAMQQQRWQRPALPSLLLSCRRRRVGARTLPPPPRASNNQGEAPVNAAARRLAELAAEAQRAAQKYARDTGLDKRAASAAKEAQKAAAAAAEEAAQAARTYQMKLEREHGLSRRWERLKKRADEAIADADANWGVRRRARSAIDTARRRWPALKARASAFLATPAGQAAAVAFLVVLIASGALWSMLSLLWVAWWFLIPFNLYMAEKKRGEVRKQAAQAQAQAQQQASSPFGGAGWPFGGASSGGGGGGGGAGGDRFSGSGPVIDAEYTVIEEDGGARKKR